MAQFTSAGGGGVPVTATILGAEVPSIANVDIILANDEVAFPLPANCKRFFIKLRNANVDLKLAYAAGTSGTDYVTVSRGTFFGEESLSASTLTLYFQATQPNQVAEIVYWI